MKKATKTTRKRMIAPDTLHKINELLFTLKEVGTVALTFDIKKNVITARIGLNEKI